MKDKQLSETDVILNFMEDCHRAFITDPTLCVEFPAGSWSGQKHRNVADIHGDNIPGIEAKGDFAAAKRDFHDECKNNNIRHYIYSAPTIVPEEQQEWEREGVAAAIFLTSRDSWYIINDHSGLFYQAIRREKIYEVPR